MVKPPLTCGFIASEAVDRRKIDYWCSPVGHLVLTSSFVDIALWATDNPQNPRVLHR